ncbi:MAG: 23S rRNA (guanosine(2251)-2'-O)-methyltransferase RlmB [Prolixibacteraceae bacterium]|nr:23S rRNA (guanosine(2251)-2'-O)-methyltransferase RlmB [Prolixibacteraceae bacterium]
MNKDEFIFGTRAVMEAIKTNRLIEKIFIKKGLKNELSQELFQLLKEEQIPFQFVPLEKINRITRKNHQGVLALLAPVEYHNIETLLPGIFEEGKDPFLLILDQITDVRNLGAIVRSAECAGVNAIIIPEKGMARISGDAVKTSAGAIHHVPICKVPSLSKTIRFLKNSGVKIVAATEKATTLYTSAKLNEPVAIVMGSEESGISNTVLQLTDEQVMIPVLGKIQSLNVSVAAAIILYEVVRQRN